MHDDKRRMCIRCCTLQRIEDERIVYMYRHAFDTGASISSVDDIEHVLNVLTDDAIEIRERVCKETWVSRRLSCNDVRAAQARIAIRHLHPVVIEVKRRLAYVKRRNEQETYEESLKTYFETQG